MHGNRVVAGAECHAVVTPMRQFNLCQVDFNTQAWPLWNSDRTFDNFKRFFGQALAILPNPMSCRSR